ncbi:hypothetical protein J2046_001353 [Rhizobium petrolearium]|nr:hypothetical protein [Neorhizobium petrolearium]
MPAIGIGNAMRRYGRNAVPLRKHTIAWPNCPVVAIRHGAENAASGSCHVKFIH